MGMWKQVLLSFLGGIFFFNTLYCQSNAQYQRVSIRLPKHFLPGDLISLLHERFPFLDSIESDLSILHDRRSPGGRHIQFIQSYAGYPIYQAGVKVNLDNGNRMISILSTLKNYRDIYSMDFAFEEADIAARYAEELGAYDAQIYPQFRLVAQTLYPVYVVHSFADAEVVSYEHIVDAQTGEEISRTDRGVYFRPPGEDTTGRARIFNPNPCTRAEVSYGDLFIDDSDAHTPVLEMYMDTVSLQDITFENDSFRLKGPYVHIVDRSPAYIAPVASGDGDFFFGRDSSGFEDVMAYYHIDRFQRYVQSLGFTNLYMDPIEVDPHGLTSDNSTLIINGGTPYLLFGEGGVDDAEDADVLVHEYCHALSYYASPETNTGRERRGLDEGIGDYFAAAVSQDLKPDFWQQLFNWDGHNEFWGGRVAVSSQTYPTSSLSIYDFGEIWASTLMQIRQDIGKDTLDRIVLQEMYMNAAGMTLEQAAQLMLDADSALYGGMNTPILNFYFCQRGLIQDSASNCYVVNVPEPDISASLTLYPNPGQGQFQIDWEDPSGSGGAHMTIYNSIGQIIYQKYLPHTGKYTIKLSQTPGIYPLIVRLSNGNFIWRRVQIDP